MVAGGQDARLLRRTRPVNTTSTPSRSPAAEKRLTTARGLDDGTDYSPDGKFIYFNSERSGLMQIWRMKPDGGDQEQVTRDDYNNWFAHPSPDGKGLVFLSYPKDVKDTPRTRTSRCAGCRPPGAKIRVLAKFSRAGHDQRPFLVARQPAHRLRELPNVYP